MKLGPMGPRVLAQVISPREEKLHPRDLTAKSWLQEALVGPGSGVTPSKTKEPQRDAYVPPSAEGSLRNF